MGRNADERLQGQAFLQGADSAVIERLYRDWSQNVDRVESQWRDYFNALGDAPGLVGEAARGAPWQRADWPLHANGEWIAALDGDWRTAEETLRIGETIRRKAEGAGVPLTTAQIRAATLDSVRMLMMIRAYRIRGHLIADLDPLGLAETGSHPELTLAFFGFREQDLDRPIFIDNVLGLETATPREIVALLKRTYCGTFALQYMHISDPEQSSWLKARIEGYENEISFTRRGRAAILDRLIEAEGFEHYLQAKYLGTKRFGLDGAESLVPAMEQIIKRGSAFGLKEIVIGMPHRGRLNVLANVMGKPYRAIFHEFRGGSSNPEDVGGSGDVKYHLGTSSDRTFDGNSVHLSLTANPSHLEAVNPVVLGKVRAKQHHYPENRFGAVMPVLLHGDAAFAGQGVVAECFGLTGLRGYRTGGAIHIVVNNQIGFTTAPHNSRSSPYPSDIALMVEAPIFHVNGDDPEAVVHAARVATEFRQTFHNDVVIDMFCYRRFGHNEGDEPMFTQPKMYERIKRQRTTLQIYGERLSRDGETSKEAIEEKKATFLTFLDGEMEAAKGFRARKADWLDGRWAGVRKAGADYIRGKTGVRTEEIRKVGMAISARPDGIALHRTVARLQDARRVMIETGEGVDWATGEALAFGTLLTEGFPVRLSGQDCARGTFSQRHSALVDQGSEERYVPLNHIEPGQATYEVIDSSLSEYAVLGFEYGYSLAEPDALVLWEAQFGDFANGAQIMIDQFICSGELKWLRMSGLVMLLPHGFEGQGPEHSSARVERFLQLSAEGNWIIANCTTPANYFHILRRQLHREIRKPLVLFTPKSLLRHKKAVSRLSEFGPDSSFHRLLHDDAQTGNSDAALKPDRKIRQVVLCSGKVYFDLLEARDARGIDDIYLMRMEQLFPVPRTVLVDELSRFPAAQIVWCQEEPENQGAWSYIDPHIEGILAETGGKARRARCVARPAAAAPATGLVSIHNAQQEALVDDALTIT